MDSQNPQQSNETLQIPDEIRNFLEGILQDAGMTAIDERMRQDMLKELYNRLDDYMLSTIVEKLSPEKTEEFTKMAESGKTREELEAYLKANIANAVEVFAQSMLEFRNLYLSNTEPSTKPPSGQE